MRHFPGQSRWLGLVCLLAACCSADTFVLSVGVEQYDDERISSLKYAVADARSIAAAFRASGVKPENVALLTNAESESASRPTRIALITNLQRIRDRARPGDKVIFFFAGHGVEENGGQYLLTVDTRRDMMAETALPIELVERALQGLQARELLCIIDACRNNPDASRSDEGAHLTEGLIRGVQPLPQPAPSGAQPVVSATLLSCDVGQRAYEDPEQEHGVFTVHLLNGLKGEAAGEDKRVRLKLLTAYVTQELSLWTQRTGKQQTPRLLNPSGEDMVILTPRLEPLVSIDARNKALADVVADVADQVGAQVVLGQGARPDARLSGHLEQQPLETALGALLQAQRLTLRKQGEIYIIEAPGAAPVSLNIQKPAEWPADIPWPVPGLRDPTMPFRVCARDGMPQVLIPAGEFAMGTTAEQLEAAFGREAAEAGLAANEQPARQVFVSAFWMDLHEVTVDQYRRFCQATGHGVSDACRAANTQPRNPVVGVSWEDAAAYAKWAGRELPTEAQWEKAARAGTTTIYPWGERWDGGKVVSNDSAKPVGSAPPNRYGLFEMIGNVEEWCRDWYDEGWYARQPSRDPVNTTRSTFRVVRGGSAGIGLPHLRPAVRHWDYPDCRFRSYGFRCVSPFSPGGNP